jgi:cytochrome d ubiquinol oxidase subunit II
MLFALFLRPVGFDYRSKVTDPRWRSAWDWGLFAGGTVPALIFGVAFGNLLQGVPFTYDDTLRITYTGTCWQLLNPFALLCGIVSVAMLTMHGAFWLQVRTEGIVVLRAEKAAKLAAFALIGCFALAGWWIANGIEGFRITGMPPPDSVITPLEKTVVRTSGAWLDNYARVPWAWLAPAAGLAGPLAALALLWLRRPLTAFLASTISVGGVVLTAGVSMFPFILPSSSHPNASLTAWDAVSSRGTLQIMFWVVVVFLPMVILYTGWVYRVLRGKVSVKSVLDNEHQMY